jgi:hypothetical protein
MARTEITRRNYRRGGLRYASHFMDAEWALIEPCCQPLRLLAVHAKQNCDRS